MVAPSKRQRLAQELRRLRGQAGVSGRELARRIGISQSKVSRIESGAVLPTMPEVDAWAAALDVPEDTRRLLAALTEAAFTEVHTWRTALQGRGHLQHEVHELERRARILRTFQPSVVPGLLQTAEYMRRVFALFHPPHDPDAIPAALAGRLERQLALYDTGRRFEFLITEAALRWRSGPHRLLIAQLDRVASLSTLENVSVGLIPHGVEATTFTSHGFLLIEPDGTDAGDATPDEAANGPEPDGTAGPSGGDAADGPGDDQAVVFVETVHGAQVVNDPESVGLYRTRWSLLRRMAIFDDEARAFLARLTAELREAETREAGPGAAR